MANFDAARITSCVFFRTINLLVRKSVLMSLLVSFSTVTFAADSDGDGVADHLDNCSEVVNPAQRDSDNDGFGNRCDTDLSNDNVTDGRDIGIFRAAFGTSDPHADFNGDGTVDPADIGYIRQYLGEPPGPGAVPPTDVLDAEASRFLAQATFGPRAEDIDNLKNLNDYDAWLNTQFGLNPSLLLPKSRAIYQAYYAACVANPPPQDVYRQPPQAWDCPETEVRSLNEIVDTYHDYFRFVWWENAIEAPDQLRQRVAFALSQILVVSSQSADLSDSGFGLAAYYDVLLRHAFGNYRDLLEEVTLHPVMGLYLSMARNEKADPSRNIRPDENYARELMQLFTIGVHELNLDGTPILDGQGVPIPSYSQAIIQAFARTFTGWNFANLNWWDWPGDADKTVAMVAWEEYHDTEPKTLLNGVTLPGSQAALVDLRAALDNVFNHSNVGPFLASQLIKRLTTSNPSPAYVARVAAVFNDNGNGVRGDLRAVVRAILLDHEARNGVAQRPEFGKLREPVLRLSHLFRAFDAVPRPQSDWDLPPAVSAYSSPAQWNIRDVHNVAGQNVLHAPSVFNFFRPDYAPPGPIANAGLVGPEFQLASENFVVAMTNLLNFHVQDVEPGEYQYWSYLQLDDELALVDQPNRLLDRLDLLLTNGTMSNTLRDRILNHLQDPSFDFEADKAVADLGRVRDAISLIINSPEYLVQK